MRFIELAKGAIGMYGFTGKLPEKPPGTCKYEGCWEKALIGMELCPAHLRRSQF